MLNDTRQKSVDSVRRKYDFEPQHANQVKNLALSIFDKTKDFLHNYSDYERDLLEAAALLHDIGHFISSDEHHKHSYILITQEKPEGFDLEEIEIIANIARYHKGKNPKKYHDCYVKLPDTKTQEMVQKLSTILRLADSLDKSHRSAIKNLDCVYEPFSETLYVILAGVFDLTKEIKAANQKRDLFEKTFRVQVELKTGGNTT